MSINKQKPLGLIQKISIGFLAIIVVCVGVALAFALGVTDDFLGSALTIVIIAIVSQAWRIMRNRGFRVSTALKMFFGIGLLILAILLAGPQLFPIFMDDLEGGFLAAFVFLALVVIWGLITGKDKIKHRFDHEEAAQVADT